ncbi:MAG: hypothetical protein GQ570_06650 [Helicobacteraceae bacterium]|nr:hypothetical protein [Helicobacteraceae bacterium]
MEIGSSNSNTLININQKKNEQEDLLKELSSGKKDPIDDPAIAMIASAMMSDIMTDTQGLQNANTAISMMQIADGAITQVSEMSTKLQELSVASGNAGLSSSEQDALSAEFSATVETINSTISNASFNGKALFGENIVFSLGSSEVSIALEDMNSEGLSIDSRDSIDDFVKQIQSAMSNIGSTSNSLQSSANNIMESITQKSAAKSQMSDTDMAEIMAKYQQNDIMLEAGMIAQAHQNNISFDRVTALLG